MTAQHGSTETLERVQRLAELWADELRANRCPSCLNEPAYCDHAEGYYHALSQLEATLRGPDPSYLTTPGGGPSGVICEQHCQTEWGPNGGLLQLATRCEHPAVASLPDGTLACERHVYRAVRVHSHPPYEPDCGERQLPSGQLRGSCLNDDGTSR